MTPEDNFTDGGIEYIPIDLGPSLNREVAGIVGRAFDILELGAFARIDLRIDSNGKPWVFDVGVAPGLGQGGAAFASVKSLGFNHADFLRIALGSKLAANNLLD